MRELKRVLWFLVAVLASVAVPGGAVSGVSAVLLANHDAGDGNVNVDLAVRQVTVTPLHAYAGDRIRIEVVIENKGEGSRTTNAELLVDGKVVARQLFTWGISPGERLHRLVFDWDTRRISPGEHRIGAQAFVWEDTSPFDNRMDVAQPVVIAPVGGEFPDGKAAGGTAMETDPRFGNSHVGR